MPSGPVALLNTVVSVVLFAGAALWPRWDLALLTFAAVPRCSGSPRAGCRVPSANSRAERDSNGALVNVLDEDLANMPLAQAYNRQDTERERVHREGVAWLRNSLARARLSNAYQPPAQVIESVSVLAVVGAGAFEIAAGRLTVGGLLAFAAYLGHPDGYDTAVGPRGRPLSGGQRQRMSIARALVRDTPVLVLDEPTTGLDAESARRVMEPLRRLAADRTRS